MAAKVVDFPVPVGPVTKTSPLGFLMSSLTTGRNSQFRKIEDVERNGSKGSGDRSPLHVDVSSESTQTFDSK
jgi:hypothetical protein